MSKWNTKEFRIAKTRVWDKLAIVMKNQMVTILTHDSIFGGTIGIKQIKKLLAPLDRNDVFIAACALSVVADQYYWDYSHGKDLSSELPKLYEFLFPKRFTDRALKFRANYGEGLAPVMKVTPIVLARAAYFWCSRTNGVRFNKPSEQEAVSRVVLAIQSSLIVRKYLKGKNPIQEQLDPDSFRKLNTNFYFSNQAYNIADDLTRYFILQNVQESNAILLKRSGLTFENLFSQNFKIEVDKFRMLSQFCAAYSGMFRFEKPTWDGLVLGRDSFKNLFKSDYNDGIVTLLDMATVNVDSDSFVFGEEPKCMYDLLFGRNLLHVKPVLGFEDNYHILSREYLGKKYIHNFSYLYPDFLELNEPNLKSAERRRKILDFKGNIGYSMEGYALWLLGEIFGGSVFYQSWETMGGSKMCEQDILIVVEKTALVFEIKSSLPNLDHVFDLSYETMEDMYLPVIEQSIRGAKGVSRSVVFDSKGREVHLEVDKILPIAVMSDNLLTNAFTSYSFEHFIKAKYPELRENANIYPFQFMTFKDLEFLLQFTSDCNISKKVCVELVKRAENSKMRNHSVTITGGFSTIPKVGAFTKYMDQCFDEILERGIRAFRHVSNS